MRSPIKRFREIEETWKKIALVCVFILIITIVIEALNFFGGYFGVQAITFSQGFMDLVHNIDLAAIVVLFIDLLWQIYKAGDRIRYVKENWLLILSFVPFGSSIRALRFLKVIKVQGSAGLKAIKVAGHASHVTKVLRPVAELLSRGKEKVMSKQKAKPEARK